MSRFRKFETEAQFVYPGDVLPMTDDLALVRATEYLPHGPIGAGPFRIDVVMIRRGSIHSLVMLDSETVTVMREEEE